MRFTFKKILKAPPKRENSSNVVGQHFNKGYAFVQSKWARWMAKRMQKLSRRAQFILWAAFAIAVSVNSSYLIYRSLSLNARNNSKNENVKKPVPHLKSNRHSLQQRSQASPALPVKLVVYRKAIDSLARSPTGRKLYDRIIREHPGLIDSLTAVEEYYKSK